MSGILGLISGIICAVLILAVLAWIVRYARFAGPRRVGAFECWIVLSPSEAGALSVLKQPEIEKWRKGLAEYHGDTILWYPRVGVSYKPEYEWLRSDLLVRRVNREDIENGHLVVACSWNDRPLLMTLSTDSYSGLAAWLESAPPGQPVAIDIADRTVGSTERLQILAREVKPIEINGLFSQQQRKDIDHKR